MTPLRSQRGIWAARWHAARSVQRRTSRSVFNGFGIYLTMALALGIAAITLHNSVRFVERNAIFVTRQPLFLPLAISTALTSIYLGLSAALSVTREYERGTLEVLLYGPVDATAFVLGAFLAQLAVYQRVALVAVVWTNIVSWLLNLQFSWALLAALVASLPVVGVVVAFGVLMAVFSRRSRVALIAFTLITLLLIGLQVADQVISSITIDPSATANDPLLVIRDAVSAGNRIAQWLSPYAQFNAILDALLARDVSDYVLHLAITMLQAVLLLGSSITLFHRRGVRS